LLQTGIFIFGYLDYRIWIMLLCWLFPRCRYAYPFIGADLALIPALIVPAAFTSPWMFIQNALVWGGGRLFGILLKPYLG